MRLLQVRKLLAVKWRQRAAVRALDAEADAPAGVVAAEPAATSPWTPARLEIVEQLWGEGCLMPGGTDEVLRLALPLGLTAASSLLLLGAGIGGGALRLAGDYGVWVNAYEADATLAKIAARRAMRAGTALAKRATVLGWNPQAPAFGRDGCHHAIAVEALGGPQPDETFAELTRAVRRGGHIMVLETVAASPAALADPALAEWCRLERRAPPRVGGDWLTGPLERLGFDIRVAEDVGMRQARLAVLGWKHHVRMLRRDRPPPLRAAAIVAEAELWLRRVRLLRAGQLRVMRWHAVGRTGAPVAARVTADAAA